MILPVFRPRPAGSDLSAIRNTEKRDTFFTPPSDHRKGHVLHIVVTEKDALQIIENNLDRSVGGVPHPRAIAAPWRDDPDLHEGLFKIRQRFLRCRVGDRRMDHSLPMLLGSFRQSLH